MFRVIEPVPNHARQAPDALTRGTAIMAVSSGGPPLMGVSYLRDDRDGSTQFAEGREAFRWTESTGTVSLGSLPECDLGDRLRSLTEARTMSSDGSVVMGSCFSAMGTRLFRWTEPSGMVRVDLPTGLLEGLWRRLSSDGTVGFGEASVQSAEITPPFQVFRWAQGSGAVALGTLPGGDLSYLSGISRDGSIAVGVSGRSAGPERDMFRWTEAGGMVPFPRPVEYGACSPRIVCEDAKAVLATCSGPSGGVTVRWTEAAGMQPLGLPPNARVAVPSMTPDGAVIIGVFRVATERPRPFRWTEPTGVVELELQGFDDCDVNFSWYPLSADGRIIVGNCSRTGDGGPGTSRGFRWSEASGAVALESLPGDDQTFVDPGVSSDGSLVWGQSLRRGASDLRGVSVVWDAAGKVRSLSDWLGSAGIDLQGFTIRSAYASSADNRMLWGAGVTADGEPRGWVARLP